MRLIVLIPDDKDLTPEGRQYFDNFVWHVRTAIREAKIDAQLLIAAPRELQK